MENIGVFFFLGGGGNFQVDVWGLMMMMMMMMMMMYSLYIHVYFILLSHDDMIVYGLNSNVTRDPTNADLWDP